MNELQPGKYLDDRYHLGAQIARGGMSTVYHAVDTRLDREVAVKVMDPALATDPTFRTRFEREARAVARLNHPSLVNVFDQGEDGPFVFLVMELVDGGSLRELLRERGPMPPHAALSVMEAVLTALSVAHATGMIHRDIKPDNVLISKKHRVKLADFGLVRAVSTQPGSSAPTSTSGQIIGTVGYLSPEQVEGKTLATTSDVYSSGILLFELITGKTPFHGGTHVETALARLTKDVPPASAFIAGVPPEIDELIAVACARSPEQRFTDGAEFLAAVHEVAAELELPAFQIPFPHESAVQQALAGSTFANRLSWDDEAMATRAVNLNESPEDAPAQIDQHTAVTRFQEPYEAPADDAGLFPATAVGPADYDHPAAPATYEQQYPEHYADREPTHIPAPHHAPPEPRQRGKQKRLSNRSPVARIIWIFVILALVAAVAIGGWWLTSGRYGEIPEVIGMDKHSAQVQVENAGFSSEIAERYSDDQPAHQVMGTDPKHGEKAPRGSDVAVLVSLGQPTVPEPVGSDTIDTYTTKLSSRTLKAIVGDEVYSDDVHQGDIAKVSPQAGTAVTTNSQVKIHISKGPRPVKIPGVSGKNADQAKSALEAAGLKIDKIVKKFDPEAEPGKAIGTSPDRGTKVSSGSKVQLILNNAIKVPDVTGLSKDQAKEALRDAGFDPEVGDAVSDDSVAGGDIARQSPTGGTLVDPEEDTEVTIRPSNSVSVPLVFGMKGKKAKDKLEDAGFDVKVNGPKNGMVWSQSPSVGSKASKGATVTISTL